MNSTSPSDSEVTRATRSPARSIAGPLVIRIAVPSSAAMIIASEVLPSPGAPDSSTWSGGRPRCWALSSSSDSCSRTRSWPMNSASRRGRSAASTCRSSSAGLGLARARRR